MLQQYLGGSIARGPQNIDSIFEILTIGTSRRGPWLRKPYTQPGLAWGAFGVQGVWLSVFRLRGHVPTMVDVRIPA